MSVGLRVSAIRGSGYVWPGKLKRPPLPSGVRIPDVKHPGGMSAAAKFRMWTSRWNGGGSRILDVIHPGGKWRQPDGIPTRVEWAMIPVRVEWVGSHTPCILDLLMDSKELSSISDCFGDQKAIKTPKLNTIWLELFARVLNMLIRLKVDNYYSKVFKRVNYKLWNSTFWVVINGSLEIKWMKMASLLEIKQDW